MSNEPQGLSSIADTPGALVNSLRAGIEQEIAHKYERRWAEQMRAAEKRTAQSLLEVREEEGAHLALSQRGHWYQLGAMAGSAIGGFAAGWHAQKHTGSRILPAIGTVPLLLGLKLNESVTTRASLVLGGVMFALGASVQAQTGPEGTNP